MRPTNDERMRRQRRPSDLDLVLAANRAKRRNRASATKRNGWERELWDAYLFEGVVAHGGVANEPSDESA